MRGLSFCDQISKRGACRCWKEWSTAKPTNAVSIYYPFALVELVDIGKTEEHEETGEVLLYFLDSDGCQVTVRLTAQTLEQLRERLEALKK